MAQMALCFNLQQLKVTLISLRNLLKMLKNVWCKFENNNSLPVLKNQLLGWNIVQDFFPNLSVVTNSAEYGL